jgi:hypothetical protein
VMACPVRGLLSAGLALRDGFDVVVNLGIEGGVMGCDRG